MRTSSLTSVQGQVTNGTWVRERAGSFEYRITSCLYVNRMREVRIVSFVDDVNEHLSVVRLNTTEVTKKSAQAASCLNARDFNKVYATAQAALEEENVSYDVLHAKYGTENYKGVLGGFLKEVEGELSKAARCEKDSKLFVCVMYFWLCSAGGVSSFHVLSVAEC